MRKNKIEFFTQNLVDGARDAESFLGPKVELGSVPTGLNLTQPLTAPKNFRDVWHTLGYGACN